MTEQQIQWAQQQQWFHCVLREDGIIIVWCYSKRTGGGLVPFTNITKLKIWAGN